VDGIGELRSLVAYSYVQTQIPLTKATRKMIGRPTGKFPKPQPLRVFQILCLFSKVEIQLHSFKLKLKRRWSPQFKVTPNFHNLELWGMGLRVVYAT
jgi:hypothetical protein